MNENAKKWVGALRSGEYKQTKNMLCLVDVGYCCLGVACELYQIEKGDLVIRDDKGARTYDEQLQILPQKVAIWLGLRSRKSLYDEGQLTTLNDRGTNFKQLADLIETEPKGLFV